MRDIDVISALIGDVTAAIPRPRGSERDVVTLITRPMWRRWCQAVGEPEESEPRFSGDVLLVYGSQTIVVESDQMVSISFARKENE